MNPLPPMVSTTIEPSINKLPPTPISPRLRLHRTSILHPHLANSRRLTQLRVNRPTQHISTTKQLRQPSKYPTPLHPMNSILNMNNSNRLNRPLNNTRMTMRTKHRRSNQGAIFKQRQLPIRTSHSRHITIINRHLRQHTNNMTINQSTRRRINTQLGAHLHRRITSPRTRPTNTTSMKPARLITSTVRHSITLRRQRHRRFIPTRTRQDISRTISTRPPITRISTKRSRTNISPMRILIKHSP